MLFLKNFGAGSGNMFSAANLAAFGSAFVFCGMQDLKTCPKVGQVLGHVDRDWYLPQGQCASWGALAIYPGMGIDTGLRRDCSPLFWKVSGPGFALACTGSEFSAVGMKE